MAPTTGRLVVAFDTETCLIRPAQLAPPMVCVTWQRPGLAPRILHHTSAEPTIREWLENRDTLIVGHNVAYDMAVLAETYPRLRPLVFQAYGDDRITCTKLRQQLLDIASGQYRRKHLGKGVFIKQTYDLETLAKRCAGIELKKDAWRLSYAAFRDVGLDKWPARAAELQAEARTRLAAMEQWQVSDAEKKAHEKAMQGLRDMIEGPTERVTDYPLDDARATLAVFQAQEEHANPWLADQYRQARAAFWLHLSSAWGLRTDKDGVEVLRRETQAQLDALADELTQLGIVRADGTRDTKAAKWRMIEVCKRDKLIIPRTDTHADEGKCKRFDGTSVPDQSDDCEEHICLDGDACEATDDPVLMHYAELSTLKKVLSNNVPALERGLVWPVHTSYGLAETGRTTSANPPIQNLTRRGGIREAFIPRLGKLFASADFPQLELFTLAQCCVKWLGASKLADALNAGLDPHLQVAALIVGVSYDAAKKALEDEAHPLHERVDEARGAGKVANFGFPGGLGIDSLVSYAKQAYGVTLTRDQAKRLKEHWYAAWPEMPYYFARVNALCDTETGKASVETLFTHRWRGEASYCASCNNGFQALGADCAKRAGWLIAKAMYIEPASPLYNARTVAFVHDEFIAEVDEGPKAHDAAVELARLMVVGANEYLPDVPIPMAKMKPLLMRRWSKKAKPRLDVDGRLVPWEG